jgi:hypothetical protein
MAAPIASPAPSAKEPAREATTQDSLSDLLKAHIRLIAVQRNVNALLLQYRDMQQEAARAEAEFLALRAKVQEETGLAYNDRTLALEPKRN